MNTNITRTLAILLSLAVAPALASEPKPLPKDLPAFGQDKPLPFPKIAESKTAEGLPVWLVSREGFPKVTVLLVVRGGTAADPKGKEGLSELLAETLKEGTARRTSKQIAEEIQSVGGTLNVTAGDDALFLEAQGLASGTETLLSLVSDIARNAAFPAQEVETAKANALQGLQLRASSPNFLADKVFASAIYGKHPYSIVAPTPAVVSAITPEVLKKEYARRFRPASSLLIVVGSFQPEAVSQSVTKAFGGWKLAGAALPETPPVPAPKGREILFVSRPGSVQSNIMVGRSTPTVSEPGYFPVLVANAVYGSGFASRLMENIREEKGYSYSPRSNVQAYQKGGLLQVRAQVRNEVTAATLMEILYELDRMGTTSVSAEELRTAQRLQTGFYLMQSQYQDAVAHALGTNWVRGLPPAFLSEYVTKVNAVTAEQVREVGRKLFASSGQTIVVVGDEKVRAELEQFGMVRDVKP
jgi:zinc protease